MISQKEEAVNKIRTAWLNFTNKYSRCVECLFVRDRRYVCGNTCIYCLEDILPDDLSR